MPLLAKCGRVERIRSLATTRQVRTIGRRRDTDTIDPPNLMRRFNGVIYFHGIPILNGGRTGTRFGSGQRDVAFVK